MQFLHWYITPLYLVTLASLVTSAIKQKQSFDKPAFIILSVLWAAGALFRPWSVTADDINYEGHFANAGRLGEYNAESVGFSYLYYLALAVVRVFDDSFTAFLLLSACFVLAKMAVVGRATGYSIASLFLYVSMFFMLHDVVQFRVGAAAFFYLLAISLLAEKKVLKAAGSYAASIFFHSQAAVAPLTVVCAKVLKARYWLAIGVLLVTQVMVYLDLYPQLNSLAVLDIQDWSRLESALSSDEVASGLRLTSLAVIALIALAVPPLRRYDEEYPLLRYAFYSVVAGFLIYWATASISVLSNRLQQFLWVPVVFMGPLMMRTRPFFFGAIAIGLAFFVLGGWVNQFMSFSS